MHSSSELASGIVSAALRDKTMFLALIGPNKVACAPGGV